MPSIPVQGMERSNLQIMKLLRQRGAEVLFVLDRLSPETPGEVERIDCEAALATFYRGFEVRLHLSRNPVEMLHVADAWRQSATEVDHIFRSYRPTHIHVTNLNYFLFALPTLWRARCPVVFRLPNPPDTDLPLRKQPLSDWIWRRCVLPYCDAVVCNSHYTLGQVKRFGVRGDRAHVIRNCLATCESHGDSDAPQVRPGKFNVVYCGRIRPEKGVGQLCEAARKIIGMRSDVDFYVAGEYHWMNPFADQLVAEVRAHGLHERIRFLGPIRDVLGLLQRCHLHVCPSTGPLESFPNVILEAKSQGLPSVVFPTAGIPEGMRHLVDGYVCRGVTAESLAEGIRFYVDQPDQLSRHGKAAKESLTQKFSEEKIGDQWAELYSGLALSRKHNGSGTQGSAIA